MDGGRDSVPMGEDEDEEEGTAPPETLAPAGGRKGAGRAEVDTSAPFESVKEAVDRFGGSARGLWKAQHKQLVIPETQYCFEEVEIMKVEEQAAQLEKDLIVKEREALDVLKELENTKKVVDDLKLKLQKEGYGMTKILEENSAKVKVHPIQDTEGNYSRNLESHGEVKLNLNRATSDLIGIRASLELVNNKIQEEKALLERTHEKLTLDMAKVSSLEQELNRARSKLELIKGAENPSDISKVIKQLTFETEQFKKMTESAKSEASELTAEIEQSNAGIKIAEIRLHAATKMEEAAKAAETVALAKIKALMSGDTAMADPHDPSSLTLPIEEYVMLTRKAQEADEISSKQIEVAMRQIDEANRSKAELQMKVEEAVKEVKTRQKALEEALSRAEAADREKLAGEEALRRRRSECGQKRRPVHGSPKFKNSYRSHQRSDSRVLDLNGLRLGRALSIGQILSQKLTGPEEDEDVGALEKVSVTPKVSLGQILSRRYEVLSPKRTEDVSACKQFPTKRKKFSFVGFSLLLAKQSKHRKKRQGRESKVTVDGLSLS